MDLKVDVKVDVKGDVKVDVKVNVKGDVKVNAKVDIKMGVKPYRNPTYRNSSNKEYFPGEHFLYFREIKRFCKTL